MRTLPEIDAADGAEAIAEALAGYGACRISGAIAPGLSRALCDDLGRLRATGLLRPAAVGRQRNREWHPDIRGDATLWLSDPRCGDAARDFLAALDALRVEFNRLLFAGLREVEAHYAVYPPGAGYARHRDRFRDDDARVLSWVTYLNEDWDEAEGGALRLHAGDGAIDVAPRIGASVCFRSELEHEVLPASRERHSIAAWFRR